MATEKFNKKRRISLHSAEITFTKKPESDKYYDKLKFSCLHRAVCEDKLQLVKRLLLQGHNEGQSDDEGQGLSVKYSAVCVDALDFCKCTALHYALKYKFVLIAALLIKHGAKTNIKNSDGKDAMAIARETNQEDWLNVFIQSNEQNNRLLQSNKKVSADLELKIQQNLIIRKKLEETKMRLSDRADDSDRQNRQVALQISRLEGCIAQMSAMSSLNAYRHVVCSHNALSDNTGSDVTQLLPNQDIKRRFDVQSGLTKRDKVLIQNVSNELVAHAVAYQQNDDRSCSSTSSLPSEIGFQSVTGLDDVTICGERIHDGWCSMTNEATEIEDVFDDVTCVPGSCDSYPGFDEYSASNDASLLAAAAELQSADSGTLPDFDQLRTDTLPPPPRDDQTSTGMIDS